jgi:hypothetical protein
VVAERQVEILHKAEVHQAERLQQVVEILHKEVDNLFIEPVED